MFWTTLGNRFQKAVQMLGRFLWLTISKLTDITDNGKIRSISDVGNAPDFSVLLAMYKRGAAYLFRTISSSFSLGIPW